MSHIGSNVLNDFSISEVLLKRKKDFVIVCNYSNVYLLLVYAPVKFDCVVNSRNALNLMTNFLQLVFLNTAKKYIFSRMQELFRSLRIVR